MDQSLSPIGGTEPADLATENVLLRASIAEMQARIAELERLVDADGLTGLPNRRRFLTELERAVGRTERHGTPTSILFIDLAGLGRINARRSYLAGDAVLVHVARLLEGLIRGTDLLARIGGDEFALILDHLDQNSAIETSERLARCIARSPANIGGDSVAVEAAIGVTTILPGDKLEDVLQRAHRNVALAKDEG